MVGGFIEQQHFGFDKQRGGQCHAHAPPAGEGGEWFRELRFFKAQARQQRGGFGWRGIRVEVFQPVKNIADFIGVGFGFSGFP